MKESKPSREYAKYLIRCELPRCSKCGQLLIATYDRSKPSKLVRFKGKDWTKTKPQFMWMFPTDVEQSKFCPYCEERLHSTKIGKES